MEWDVFSPGNFRLRQEFQQRMGKRQFLVQGLLFSRVHEREPFRAGMRLWAGGPPITGSLAGLGDIICY